MKALSWLVLALALVLAGASGAQQDLSRGQFVSAILTVDSERLYQDSAFGKRVASELDAASEALSADNRRIEAELEAEEEALTARRPDLTAEEFRVLADAFDQKVQNIRREREAEGRALSQQLEEDRRQFLGAAAPVLEQLMREAGAAVILERRTVFLSATAIDITDLAIERIDAALGDGGTPPD